MNRVLRCGAMSLIAALLLASCGGRDETSSSLNEPNSLPTESDSQALVVDPATDAVVYSTGNRISNPSFEADATRWYGWQSNISRLTITGAPNRTSVGRVAYQSGSAGGFSIHDNRENITSTVAGKRYITTGHVRAASAGSVGKTLYLGVREWTQTGTKVAEVTAPVVLSNSFQKITLTHAARASNNRLEVYFILPTGVLSDSFYLDAVSVLVTAPTYPAVGVQFHCAWSMYSDSQRETMAKKMDAAGMGWVRIDVSWAGIEKDYKGHRDPWYVNMVDRCVNFARANNLKVLIVLYQTPNWAQPSFATKEPANRPDNANDYRDFAQWASTYWRGRVAAWEVWNEPDPRQRFFKVKVDPSGVELENRAVKYVELLAAAKTGINIGYGTTPAGDPSAKIVFGGPSSNDDGWIRQCYQAGAKPHFDVMATHPYQGIADKAPEEADLGNPFWFTHLPAVWQVMLEYQDSHKKIWFTEFGWSAHANWSGVPNHHRGVTAEQQGDFFTRAVDYARANYPYVENMIWYKSRSLPGGTEVHEEGYGLTAPDMAERRSYWDIKRYLTGL